MLIKTGDELLRLTTRKQDKLAIVEALMLQEDLKSIVVIRVEEEQFLDVNVDLGDNNLAKLLAEYPWSAEAVYQCDDVRGEGK